MEVNYTEPSPSVSIPRLNVGIMNLVMQSVIYNLLLRVQLLIIIANYSLQQRTCELLKKLLKS
jgi:hypothetical protein